MRQAPVLVYSNWRQSGSLPASVSALLLTAIKRLDGVPLNPTIGFFPFASTDSVSLQLPRLSVANVARVRREARVRRKVRGTALVGDFTKTDWEFALADLSHAEPELRLGASSFIAVDTIAADGWPEAGPRPVLGHRVRRSEPTLPRLLGLRTRNASSHAIATLCETELLLIDLAASRGKKTIGVLKEILSQRDRRRPTILLAEAASQIATSLDLPLIQAVSQSICGHATPPDPVLRVHSVGRERVQHEQEIIYALGGENQSANDERLALLFRAAWQALWQRVDGDKTDPPILRVLRQELEALRRYSVTAADRYVLASTLLLKAAAASAPTVMARRLATIEAARKFANEGKRRVLLLVGTIDDERAVRALELESLAGIDVRVRLVRQVAGSAETAEACIVCGYWGPVTLDALLRARPRSVAWVIDPIETGYAARDCTRQADTLSRVSLAESARPLELIAATLSASAGGVHVGLVQDHADVLEVAFWSSPAYDQGDRRDERESDGDQIELWFNDGSAIRVPTSHRFDVIRGGAPHPTAVYASELSEGDQVLLVRGDHQRTLSELLLEDMDSAELSEEAALRRAWQQLCSSSSLARRLTPAKLARQVREQGGRGTPESVRWWLKAGSEGRAPSDYKTFLAFSAALGLPEPAIRPFYDAIRRWRVAHRKRGRDVVRLLRLAWFGGLSAADLARAEERWGLGVRDLVEGSRVLEVEAVRHLAARSEW